MRKRLQVLVLHRAALVRKIAAIFLLQLAETDLSPQAAEVGINWNLSINGVDNAVCEQYVAYRQIKYVCAPAFALRRRWLRQIAVALFIYDQVYCRMLNQQVAEIYFVSQDRNYF